MRTLLLLVCFFSLHAQERNLDWFLEDPETGGAPGVAAEQSGKEFDLRPPAKPVLVAVIDSGIDLSHPIFAGLIYENLAEASGKAGTDDDGNGFVDDVHGWNFLGNIVSARMESVREIARLETLAAQRPLSATETAYLELVRESRKQDVQQKWMPEFSFCYRQHVLRQQIQQDLATLTATGSQRRADDPEILFLQRALQQIPDVSARLEQLRRRATVMFDPTCDERQKLKSGKGDPRSLIGTESHGTMVAGIIASVVRSAVGSATAPQYLKILPIRAVPDGDENDIDVAAALRYAADQGATIINMSFGKGFSPQPELVQEAIEYCRRKNILLVHASGNDGVDIRKVPHYPNGLVQSVMAENWIDVAASTSANDQRVVASFSNYGATMATILAPGARIRCAVPGGEMRPADGTSMAAPMVSGVAAVLKSQCPDLDAKRLRAALLSGIYTPKNSKGVQKPGGIGKMDLSEIAEAPGKGVQKPGGIGKMDLSEIAEAPGIVNLKRSLKILQIPLKNP